MGKGVPGGGGDPVVSAHQERLAEGTRDHYLAPGGLLV